MTAHDTVAENIAATADVALRAVARHMLDHDLQVVSIRRPALSLGERSVIVAVPDDDLDGYWAARWSDTLAVDATTADPVTHPDLPQVPVLFERYVVHGRLPDSGVRVSVVAIRRLPGMAGRPLTVVPTGGAA